MLREPLLHFIAFGILVVGLDAAFGPSVQAPQRIEVTPALIEDIRRQQVTALERAPSPEELRIAVESWIEEEMLVREARARGLDRGDAQVRGRLAEKMAFLMDAREVPAPPDEADLRALFEAEGSELVVSGQLTLRQHFARGAGARARAEAMLGALKSGQPAQGGDAPPGGPVLRGRRLERLREIYGELFARGLDTLPLQSWALRESDQGWHVVQVTRRREPRALTFEEARTRLIARWRRQQTQAAVAAALEGLRARYELVGWPP